MCGRPRRSLQRGRREETDETDPGGTFLPSQEQRGASGPQSTSISPRSALLRITTLSNSHLAKSDFHGVGVEFDGLDVFVG